MYKETIQNANNMVSVDKALSEPTLKGAPRALLLLRVCQFAQAFRPDILDHYWKQLLKVRRSLDEEYRKAFKVLKASIEPLRAKKHKGFTREIIDTVNTAFEPEGSPKDGASLILQDCEERLRKRWWPFGKKKAWIALVQAYTKVERGAALRLIKRVPYEVKKSTIHQLNHFSPLTLEEWDLTHKHSGEITTIIKEILDDEKPDLHIYSELAETIGSQLLKEIYADALPQELEHKAEARRKKAHLRYIKLVSAVLGVAPDTAESLMERLFNETKKATRFNEKWAERFTALREVINYWAAFSPIIEKAAEFLVKQNTGYLRDFALSHWQGITVTSQEEAEKAIGFLNQECDDEISSEIWFLVTLVRRGMGETAVSLACCSLHSTDLLPRIRRAWLSVEPGKASSVFTTSDFSDDIIGQFLLLKSDQERVEFLRGKTGRGQESLPTQMWCSISRNKILSQIGGRNSNGEEDRSLLTLYSKAEPVNNHFKEYVRMHGYSKYDCRDLDPHLLTTLLTWDDKYPREVESLLSKMWDVIRPNDDILTWDTLRSIIFERCYTVFSVSPQSLDKLFIRWVKRKLVDNSVTQYSGGMTSYFSLKPFVIFLYCLLSAEKVVNLSPLRCDDIIKRSINTYTTEEDFMESAAKLFASNKGLSAIIPPVDLLEPNLLPNWQMGVIEASTKEVLAWVMGQGQKENNPNIK